MKIKYLYLLTVLLILSFITSCDTVQQTGYEDTGVGGNVVDSTLHLPVKNAEILLLPDGTKTYTDDFGNYYIGHIHVPSSAGNYYLYISKPGYDTVKYYVFLYAGDTTRRVDVVLFNSVQEVYENYNVHVYGFQNSHSLSSVNLYDLVASEDTNYILRDMRLRDSAGTGQVYWLLSGYDNTSGNGLETHFTSLIGYYDHNQFDGLSALFGGRPFDPQSDFPFLGTNSFQMPSVSNMVFGYYLYGRHGVYGDPKIYGLIRIADVYYDTGLNNTVVVLDLKVNRKGNNNFLVSQPH
ncbi:MAG: carboxypeptidase-like regulatory domain-containing protein [Bacteroidetes bacterium]|nr:carboxypeptidase-like regulatory domain-containing protein [Bacteroidota bacterium]